ncbi:Caspase-7 [Tyrophagus putrescentiae]|nr:Caspase-7 [Tyrophagus putrescentiae]
MDDQGTSESAQNGDTTSAKLDDDEEGSSEVDTRLWFSFGRGVIPNPVAIPDRSLLYYPLRPVGHRGRALIFNWEHFSSSSGKGLREGSGRDVQRLLYSLSKLGFAVQEPLQDLSTSKSYIVLLSHGEKGDLICTTDGGTIRLEQITALFTADRCPTLAGKPKLFFIQACRGTRLDSGVLVTDSPSRITPEKSSPFLLPTQADFFLFFSTVAGHYAWRNTSTGSWFIQDLCFVPDLGTLATLVCQRVAFTRESVSDEGKMNAKKQSPVVVSTLTRLLRFGPWRLKEGEEEFSG